jgi:hypothetical protein
LLLSIIWSVPATWYITIAKPLGLAIPETPLAAADEVIE